MEAIKMEDIIKKLMIRKANAEESLQKKLLKKQDILQDEFSEDIMQLQIEIKIIIKQIEYLEESKERRNL